MQAKILKGVLGEKDERGREIEVHIYKVHNMTKRILKTHTFKSLWTILFL